MCEEKKEVIEDFASELEILDKKIQKELKADLTSLDSGLSDIAKKIDELYLKRDGRLKATKGRFNLFTTLLGIGDETRLHSRFITHLLNPKANHDCGKLFLDLFIDTISERDVISDKNAEKTFENIKNQKCKLVCTEQPASGRRIDIYLEFDGYIIAIENKIWADEQPDQIYDYKKYIDEINTKTENNTENEINFLFYLTLDGKESATSNGAKYFPISYKNHVLKWLEKCLQATFKYVNINQAIQQYQNVIKQLTNQTMEIEEMKEINELIQDKPLIIKYKTEIDNSIEALRKDTELKYWNLFSEILQEKGYKVDYQDALKDGIHYIITNQEFSDFSFELIKNISTRFMMIGLWYELSVKEVQEKFIENKSKLKEISDKSHEDFAGGYDSNWFAGTYHIFPGDYFSNDFLFDLIEKKNWETDCQEKAEDVIKYLDYMTKELDELINK